MSEVSILNRVAIGDVLRRSASRFPNKTAFVEGENRLTFKESDHLCNQFANYLLDNGMKKGDTIATICGNSIEYIIIMFGIAKAGLTWVPINPGISLEDKKYILNEVKPKLIIGDNSLIGQDLGVYKTYSDIINLDGKVETFFAHFGSYSKYEPNVEIHDRDVAQIMFTSGTTGNPKGVKISHVGVCIASLGNIIEVGINTNHVGTTLMPLFHCAQHAMATSFINIGATNVIFKTFNPEEFMSIIEKEKVSWTFALPMIYRAILHHPSRKNYDLSSLDKCLYAMAPMDRTTLELLIKELGAEFSLGTGQTEVYPATMTFKSEEQLRRSGSYWGVSSLINDTEIMDENGNILEAGQIGEIVHRGPNVMIGYLNNEEETKYSREFDWHHTGDLGYWDEDNQLMFVDRKKDVIKTGGENVASIKVEQVLLDYEKVGNAVAIGLPHKRWIEAVTAFIVPKPGVELTEEELIVHCKKHLGSFQVPKSFVIVEELPTTTTGKIQKHMLRKTFVDHYENESALPSLE